MSSTLQPKEIFNCVKAAFDPVDKITIAEWSICYGQPQNKLLLSVQLNQPEQFMQGSPLISTLDLDALNELLEFLAHVKTRMTKSD